MLSYITSKPYEVVLWLLGLMVALWIFGLLGIAVVIDTGGPPWYIIATGLWISSIFVVLLLGIAPTAKEAFWIGTTASIMLIILTIPGSVFVSWLLT